MGATTGDTARWGAFEQWSPRLFLGGGVLLLGAVVNNSLIFFAGMSLPEALSLGLFLTGFVAALVGLVGFYPELRDRTPGLARASLAAVAGAALGLAVLVAWAVAMLLFSAPQPSPVVALPILLLLLAGFCLFGVAVLRTGTYPRPVGVLLLALVAVLFVVFGRRIVLGGDPSDVFVVTIEAVEGMIMLGIWYLLRTSPAPARREEPSPA